MSARSTNFPSATAMYCSLTREPSFSRSRWKEIRSDGSVAEYNLTGIATSPNEMVRDAMERADLAITSVCRAWTWTARLPLAVARNGPQPGARPFSGRHTNTGTPDDELVVARGGE